MICRTRLSFFVLACCLVPGAEAAQSGQPARPEIAPSTFTLTGKEISLRDALAELKKQTGMAVADVRKTKTNPRLSLDLRGATFWQAVDAIAKAANVSVSLYQAEGQTALAEGPFRPAAVSYGGLFRTVVKRVTLTEDLETGTHYAVVFLETAWEPRLEPFYLDQGPSSVAWKDARGRATKLAQQGMGQSPVHGRNSLEFAVRFPAPDRSVVRLASLQGKLTLVTPSKMLTFTFDKLARMDRGSRPRQQTQDGIKVRLTRLLPDDDPLDVEITLDYPAEGPHFESYQSWLTNNDITLVRTRGKGRVKPLQGGLEFEESTYPHARIRYHFPNKNNRLANLRDWKLVYRTPGRIVAVPMEFAFKDLRLP
jgi:hypothetical protein